MQFRQYLDTLPLAYKKQITLAEYRYLANRYLGAGPDPVEVAFLESLQGYMDLPAGIEIEEA
jgi:hypothetical protein